jgi:hypothetical protein
VRVLDGDGCLEVLERAFVSPTRQLEAPHRLAYTRRVDRPLELAVHSLRCFGVVERRHERVVFTPGASAHVQWDRRDEVIGLGHFHLRHAVFAGAVLEESARLGEQAHRAHRIAHADRDRRLLVEQTGGVVRGAHRHERLARFHEHGEASLERGQVALLVAGGRVQPGDLDPVFGGVVGASSLRAASSGSSALSRSKRGPRACPMPVRRIRPSEPKARTSRRRRFVDEGS